jgi:hypothetical protein
MPCKVVDQLAKTPVLAVRRVLISGFLMSILATSGVALLPISGVHAQGIRTEVEHHKDMEVYYRTMRDEFNNAATDDDNLFNVKQNEPPGMDHTEWRNWGLTQPALTKWIENYEKSSTTHDQQERWRRQFCGRRWSTGGRPANRRWRSTGGRRPATRR